MQSIYPHLKCGNFVDGRKKNQKCVAVSQKRNNKSLTAAKIVPSHTYQLQSIGDPLKQKKLMSWHKMRPICGECVCEM